MRTVLLIAGLLLAGTGLAAPPVPDAEIATSIDRLYAAAPRPLWIGPDGPTAAARAVLAELAAAETRGLRSQDYDAVGLQQRILALHGAARDPGALAFDRELSRLLARFIAHLQRGRVRPQDAGYALELHRAPPDLAAAVAAVASSASPAAVLDADEPRYRHYALLKRALARYRQLAATGADAVLPPLPRRSIKPGERYAGVPALRRELARLGDLEPAQGSAGDTTLDAVVTAALARFQQRHGLAGDGVLGVATWHALNVPLAQRVHQIELAMERVRWLPPPPESPFILVNIPQFRLFAFRGPGDQEREMTAMNVIVGKTFPQTHTPVFQADMRFVVFRPYWDVPTSIMRKELLPQLRRNPQLAQKEGYELVRGQRDASPIVPLSDAALEELAHGALRIRQRAGPKNALGAVKFMLPNPYDVYLHSTPAQQLFDRSLRAFSHGCVRVEDPVGLAQFVFAEDPEWTRERITAAMQEEGPPQRVNLKHPIPVFVFYATAIAAEDGRVLFFEDLYEHDRKLDALLGAAR